jgi:hypothetical protein
MLSILTDSVRDACSISRYDRATRARTSLNRFRRLVKQICKRNLALRVLVLRNAHNLESWRINFVAILVHHI